jgi:hypothetical protein
MQKIRASMVVTAGLLLLLLSCCKQPVQPIVEIPLNFDEPDTIKSFVSFTLRAPVWNVYRWEGKLPSETLSKERVTPDEISIMRIPQDGLGFSHAIKSSFCHWYVGKGSDLISRDYPRLGDTIIDALRSWRGTSISVSFRVPKTIQTPISFASDSMLTFSYVDARYQEMFVARPRPNKSSILSFVSDVFSKMEYWPPFWQQNDTSFYSLSERNLYRTRVERSEFYLDRYDTVRQRVDGRFSFRMIGYDGTVIDIKDGRFINVKLARQNK